MKSQPLCFLSLTTIAGDFKAVARWVSQRFGVEVSADWCRLQLQPVDANLLYAQMSEYWVMWWKNRLAERGAFPCRGEVGSDRLTVELHMGFLSVEETAEQLEILRRPEPKTPQDQKREAEYQARLRASSSGDDSLLDELTGGDPARSRISKTNEKIKPIDRVAVRVAPPPSTSTETPEPTPED